VANFPRGEKPHISVAQGEEAGALEAKANGVRLALHPHMFTPIQTAHEAEQEMQKHPELRFLPDVAHLTVAGEEVVEVLKRNSDRLETIHLKDWTPEFGRAYQFYARGFVELGQGQVDLEGTIEFLKAQGFRGWVIVDQNFTLDPSASARESRAWLRDHHAV
jgi:sugar phosphate isomerase/epimerase